MIQADIDTSMKRSRRRVAAQRLILLSVLAWSGVCAADILNPSFEATYYLTGYGDVPLNWKRVDNPAFNSCCTNLWTTDGARSISLLSRLTNSVKTFSFNAGDYQALYQVVDLTGVDSIQFDARLAAYPSGLFEHFEASLLIDGESVWSRTADGVYLDERVNVSHLAGWCRVELRNTAMGVGSFDAAYWAQWDNLRLVEGPTTIPAVVDLRPETLDLACKGRWVTCYITLPEEYDVHFIDGATVTLNGIGAHMGHEDWAQAEASDGNITDHDRDGNIERMVKFDRAAVQAIVTPPEAKLVVMGNLLGDAEFQGDAVIRVCDGGNGREGGKRDRPGGHDKKDRDHKEDPQDRGGDRGGKANGRDHDHNDHQSKDGKGKGGKNR